jgi:ketosteroid isomerase-like protein
MTMGTSAFGDFVETYHGALDQFFGGNPIPAQALYSHREDATLANPFGPVAKGWKEIAGTMERAAANYRDGGARGFDAIARLVTPELAYLVEVEHFRAKIGDSDDFEEGSLRVTSVLRPEDGAWRIVHRHADPITTPRPSGSVIQRGS